MAKRPGVVLAISALLLAAGPAPAQSHWLTEIAEIAARSGSKAGRLAGEAGADLGHAAGVLARLPAELKMTALAAEALPDGAWRFVNAAGETITATSAADIRKVINILSPTLAKEANAAPTLLIGMDSLFAGRDALKSLPSAVDLRLAHGDAAIPLIRQAAHNELKLYAELSAELVVEASDRFRFEEALWRLARPLVRSRMRVLSLDAASRSRLPVAGPKTKAGGLPAAEPIAAFDLMHGFANLNGQTTIVTGRIDGAMLRFADASGVERSIAIDRLFAAAQTNGVDLILLGSETARQPGVKTWLLQETAIAELDRAMASNTLGDLYAAFGRGQGRLALSVVEGRGGFLRLAAKPAEDVLPPPSGVIEAPLSGEALLDASLHLLSSPLGQIRVTSIETSALQRDQQEERDGRLIPFVPVVVQNILALSIFGGLIGWSYVVRWSNGLWARWRSVPSARSWRGWLAETIVLWLVLLPVLGIPALGMVAQKGPTHAIRGLFRATKWLFGYRAPPVTPRL